METRIHLTILRARAHEREALAAAAAGLTRVVNSTAFANRIRRHQYRGRARFAENLNIDNAGILRVLRTGRELLRGIDDFSWDIDVEVKARRRRTVGYTYPGIATIFMNRRVLDFSEAGVPGLMNNIAHEYCHKLGFDHEGKRETWELTVPYAVGRIVEELAS